jgi:hypothetical protein
MFESVQRIEPRPVSLPERYQSTMRGNMEHDP